MSDPLDLIAYWFAHEIVANETEIVGFKFPPELRERVVELLVSEDRLGWPDRVTAGSHYDDYIETENG